MAGAYLRGFETGKKIFPLRGSGLRTVRPEFNPESRRDRRYTIAICKGAGLVDETRQLMNYWRPGEEVKAFVQRVQEEDLLGRYTAYRARNIARRVFGRWFLIPSDRPAPMLKGIVDLSLPHKTFAAGIGGSGRRSLPVWGDHRGRGVADASPGLALGSRCFPEASKGLSRLH
jgi:Putative inner membrane protein (DUF1819)